MKCLRGLLTCGLLIASLGACSHTTTISVRPVGAKIYIDGEVVGTSQVSTDIGNGLGGAYRVRVEAEPHVPMEIEISRSHLSWSALGAALAGCAGGGLTGGTLGSLGACVGLFGFFDDATWMLASLGVGTACAVVSGAPFLLFLGGMNHGPDAISVDLESGTVLTTPRTEFKIVEGGDAQRGNPLDLPGIDQPAATPAETPAENPAPEPPVEPRPEPVVEPAPEPPPGGVKPFDY